MRKEVINLTVRSARRCLWFGLCLTVTANIILSTPVAAQSQSENPYWVTFRPGGPPGLLSGKLLGVRDTYSCEVRLIWRDSRVFVNPVNPSGKDPFGNDLALFQELDLFRCKSTKKPTINQITSIKMDLRGKYNPSGVTIKSATFTDQNGRRSYYVTIKNARIRVETGQTPRGYIVLADINYTFSENISPKPTATIELGSDSINAHTIVAGVNSYATLTESQLNNDIKEGKHPTKSAVLGSLLLGLTNRNVSR